LPINLVGRALHLPDIFDKIKTMFVKERLTQQKHRSPQTD